jgi:calcium/calmodulin-dependent protein kinase I
MTKSQHNPLFVETAEQGNTFVPGRAAFRTIGPISPITDRRSRYHFGKTLGAGTYGIVREADIDGQKVAVKIILKKNVKGNEQMVYDELKMLQNLNHPHIVRFHDWFESRVSCSIIWGRDTNLLTWCRTSTTLLHNWLPAENCSTEFVTRANSQRKMLHKLSDKSLKQSTISTNAISSIEVCGCLSSTKALLTLSPDLKPENLLYLTRNPKSELVLADFGIAKMLDSPTDVLTTMAGSFGYAAPEVMLKQGHGKAVDMWSLGVITYTLLCGYSPFRSENLNELVEECRSGHITFHERYWKDVSKDAKEFIMTLLQTDPHKRASSTQALQHVWLKGESASDHDLLPEIRKLIAKARLKRGIELVRLANRIEQLRLQEDEEEGPGQADIPANAEKAAGLAVENQKRGISPGRGLATGEPGEKRSLSKLAKGAIFREVVLAKVREMKDKESQDRLTADAVKAHERRKSQQGLP